MVDQAVTEPIGAREPSCLRLRPLEMGRDPAGRRGRRSNGAPEVAVKPTGELRSGLARQRGRAVSDVEAVGDHFADRSSGRDGPRDPLQRRELGACGSLPAGHPSTDSVPAPGLVPRGRPRSPAEQPVRRVEGAAVRVDRATRDVVHRNRGSSLRVAPGLPGLLIPRKDEVVCDGRGESVRRGSSRLLAERRPGRASPKPVRQCLLGGPTVRASGGPSPMGRHRLRDGAADDERTQSSSLVFGPGPAELRRDRLKIRHRGAPEVLAAGTYLAPLAPTPSLVQEAGHLPGGRPRVQGQALTVVGD